MTLGRIVSRIFSSGIRNDVIPYLVCRCYDIKSEDTMADTLTDWIMDRGPYKGVKMTLCPTTYLEGYLESGAILMKDEYKDAIRAELDRRKVL